MRASKAALLVALVALSLAGLAAAAGKANPNRGKALYKANCKICHVKGGEAKDLTPLSKTQAQWQKFFTVGAPACAKKAEAKTGKPLTADDLADMELFLVSHAADSDQPETCGQ
jgi:cytochrome c5